jgi:hypothetical protein
MTMKKYLIVSVLLIIAVMAFSASKIDVYQEVTALSSKCVAEGVFTQPLVDLSTGNIWGRVVYLPFSGNFGPQFDLKNADNKAAGFIVIIFNETKNKFVQIGDVTFKGKAIDGKEVMEKGASYFYFGTNATIGPMNSSNYDKIGFLIGDKSLVLEAFQTYGKISNKNYQVKISMSTSSASWYVLQKGNEYKRYLNLLKSAGY